MKSKSPHKPTDIDSGFDSPEVSCGTIAIDIRIQIERNRITSSCLLIGYSCEFGIILRNAWIEEVRRIR